MPTLPMEASISAPGGSLKRGRAEVLQPLPQLRLPRLRRPRRLLRVLRLLRLPCLLH
jgi:hypothetical protein